jgi:acylphosphatase
MQARIYISGFVQSVGFRWFVKWNARKLKLTGWVKNTSDGEVEALVQGEKEKIEKLIVACKKGPLTAEVKAVKVEWEIEQDRFLDFATTR